MFLIVGLGNPGSGYSLTRHNAGFIFLDFLSEKHQLQWKEAGKFNAIMTKAVIGNQEVLLCKPQCFMNLSGAPVLSMSSYYKIKPDNIIVIHDDLDFPAGRIMYKFGGGAGGHNGLKSIDKVMGPNYHRIRIGIGRPQDSRQEIADFVLQNFTHEEMEIIERKVTILAKDIELLLQNKIEEFKAALKK